MPNVFIVVPAKVAQPVSSSTVMVQAMKQAVLNGADIQLPSFDQASNQVEVVTPEDLAQIDRSGGSSLKDALLCPLTLSLPDSLSFPGQAIYQQCQNIAAVRHQVEAWEYATGAGDLWLPIVLTAKGPLYAEAIGRRSATQSTKAALHYTQPVHLTDQWRQPLYELGYRLLQSLSALPAVYLLQFSLHEQTICFDRVLPFPDVPAIASLDSQTPDLFTCHWRCLTGQPIYDLLID